MSNNSGRSGSVYKSQTRPPNLEDQDFLDPLGFHPYATFCGSLAFETPAKTDSTDSSKVGFVYFSKLGSGTYLFYPFKVASLSKHQVKIQHSP